MRNGLAALRNAAFAIAAVLLASCGGSGGGEAEPSTRAPLVAAAKSARVAADYTSLMQGLYVACFGRPADPAGLAFWASYLALGNAPTDTAAFNAAYFGNAAVKLVTDRFGAAPESVALYGTDSGVLIDAIYRNLFNRPPDASGFAFYSAGLSAGLITTAQAATMIAGGARGADAQVLQAKVAVATRFTAGLIAPQQIATYSGLTVNTHLRAMLRLVDDSTDPGAAAAGMLTDLDFPLAGAGELRAGEPLGTIAAADIALAVASSGPAIPGLDPRYAVNSYRVQYLTTDTHGNQVLASGLVSVPVKPASAASPVLAYHHGTLFRDADAPSNHAVAAELTVVLASLGFIAVAPDYVGYGVSKGSTHPYLLSTPSAAAAIDFLSAARTWRRRSSVADNGQLFITGYSEGGYVAMAAHRALQASQSAHLPQLRMAVPGAGPYDVQSTLDGLLDIVRDQYPVLGALLSPGLLRYLGSGVRNEIRKLLLKLLLPDDADVTFDTRFVDNFLADDVQAVESASNVHNWKPGVPIRMFHGRDDQTVPYASSTSTLRAMQAQGAGNLATLTDCTAVPSSHLGCVPDFLGFLLRNLGPQAQGL